jgi:transglutaminase-like putative cysteine protease
VRKLREFFRHFQINYSITHLWRLLFFNVILSLLPFIVAAPVPVTIAFGFVASLSIIFHLLGFRLYAPITFILAIFMSISLKSVLPGGTFSGEYFSVLFSAFALLKTFNLRKYGDGVILLILTLGTNAVVLLMSQDSSTLVTVWSFAVTLFTIVNLLRLNLRDLSSVALIASIRSALVGTLYTLPLLIFLFYFFQKFSHMSLYARGDSNISGISRTLEPGRVESLTKNSAVAFRAVMNRNEFPFISLYWKGPTLSVSQGMKWTRGIEGDLESPPRMGFSVNDPCAIEQTIFLQGLDLAPYRLALDAPIPSLYSAISSNSYRTTSKICHESRLVKGDSEILKRYLEVGTEITPEVKVLAHQLAMGTKTPREFASRLYKFYRSNHFKYSLNPPAVSPFHQMDDFLFHKKVGFCEHFSASFATLARLAGYPSRIVTGFQGGKYNRFGNYWLVTYQDAHAWVELWDKNLGWVQMDPTSIVAPERIENGASEWLKQIEPWWEKIEDNGVWQAGDAFFFWLRSLFNHRDTLISLDDMTVTNTQVVALLIALVLFLVVRRTQRNYETGVREQFRKLCVLLDQRTIPRGRAEGFDHYRARLGGWMKNERALETIATRVDQIFLKMIRYRYGQERPVRADLRVFYYELRSTRISLQLKTNFFVRLFSSRAA